MRHVISAALAAALSIAGQAAFAECDDGEIVMKFSHVTNVDRHPKGIAAALFAERVNAELDGTACMQVFPNSTLYHDDKVLEAMLAGDVHFAAPSLSNFEGLTKRFRIFDLPFMFKNAEAVEAFQNSDAGQAMKESMASDGILGLEFWHNGFKQMSANRPIIVPSDAEGLKFRVQASEVLEAQMAAVDAEPHRIVFGEVHDALRRGVVDGQENTWSNIYGQRFFEVQDGVTETNHGIIEYLVITPVDWWQALDDDLRVRLASILRDVTISRNTEARALNEVNKRAIMDDGGIVRTLTAEQRSLWVDAMKPVWKKFEGDVGRDTIEAVQAINAGL